MKKIIFPFLLLLFFPLNGQEKDQASYDEVFRLADAWLEAQRDYDFLPGISAALVSDQDLIWEGAFGYANPDQKIPASPKTLYSICSISKLFTSVAIMKLYDEGKLRLDDEIHNLLPWFNLEQHYPESGPVTIRSLLTHSSGLPRESDHPYWSGPDFPFPSREEVREGLSHQQTLYPASTYFQYSNLGMTLLGEVVAEVSGMPYETYVEKEILRPLRLNSTKPRLPEQEWGKELAVGFSALRRDGTRYALPLFQAKGIAAAAGFSSNVEDLARFASWQFRLLENGGTEILKAATLKEMQRVQWMDPDWGTTWGLGFSIFRIDGQTIVGHGGSCPGYRSVLMMDPENKMAAVVMINAQHVDPGVYASGLGSLMKKASGKKVSAEGFNPEEYVGTYNAQPWSGETLVVPWEGKLAVLGLPTDDPAGDMMLLKHVEGDVFVRMREDGHQGEEVRFERDGSGHVIRMWQHNNFNDKIK